MRADWARWAALGESPSTTNPAQLPVTGGDNGGVLTAAPGVDFRTGGAVAKLGIVNCPPPQAEGRDGASDAVKKSGEPPDAPAGGPKRVLVVRESPDLNPPGALGATA